MKSAVCTQGRPAQRATVLVADDHVLVRYGIRMLVADVLGEVRFLEAEDGDSLQLAAGSQPSVHLALVDVNMPGMLGGLRLAQLAHLYPGIAFVVISTVSSPEVIRRIMNIATVYAFLPKNADRGRIRSAIEAAMQGRKLPYACADRGDVHSDIALTPRQREIRGLLRQGMSNKMIAGALGISEGTVKNHITEIFKVLNATNRTQAAQLNFEAE